MNSTKEALFYLVLNILTGMANYYLVDKYPKNVLWKICFACSFMAIGMTLEYFTKLP